MTVGDIMEEQKINQDRKPNFRDDGRLYLVRCFICDPKYGLENYAFVVATGQCYKCGWKESIDE